MAAYNTTGIVVRRINVGETDRIITLFTADLGKLDAIAKGCRRPRSRVSGATELFTESRFHLGAGRTLEVVSQAEILRSFPSLRQSLDLMTRATYFCELLDRFTVSGDASGAPELFALLSGALDALAEAGTDPRAITHAFEIRLLDVQGYAPVLDACVRCGAGLPGGQVGFSPTLGGALCPEHRRGAEDALSLRHATVDYMLHLATCDLEALRSVRIDNAAESQLAPALQRYLRARTDRDIKSGSFLMQLDASQQVTPRPPA